MEGGLAQLLMKTGRKHKQSPCDWGVSHEMQGGRGKHELSWGGERQPAETGVLPRCQRSCGKVGQRIGAFAPIFQPTGMPAADRARCGRPILVAFTVHSLLARSSVAGHCSSSDDLVHFVAFSRACCIAYRAIKDGRRNWRTLAAYSASGESRDHHRWFSP